MTEHVLASARSHVHIRTFAEGLLSRLAHDLELECRALAGTASRSDEDGTSSPSGSASIELPLSGIVVGGVLGKDRLRAGRTLSPSEARECLAKMCESVFHARSHEVVRIEVNLAEGSATLRVIPPNGRLVTFTTRPKAIVEGDAIRATGSFELSLAAIGAGVVKGPMGAFRVKDRVEIVYDIAFERKPQT